MAWKIEQLDFVGCDRMKPCEEREVTIILEEEKRALISGVVRTADGKAVKGAVVKLFLRSDGVGCDEYDLTPITFTFTDEHGRFLFAVEPDKDYTVLVFYNKTKDQSFKHRKIDIKNLDLL